jgi:hypothetical protein
MWIQWLGTVLLLAAAIHCGVRLDIASRSPAGSQRASDATHVLMCLGLAAMLTPLGDPIPVALWEAAFCLVVAWSLIATIRERDRRLLWARHAVEGVAMIYMFATPLMSPPGLTWILVVYCVCSASWSALMAVRAGSASAAQVATADGPSARLPQTWVLAPWTRSLGEAVMTGSMAWMLLAMR